MYVIFLFFFFILLIYLFFYIFCSVKHDDDKIKEQHFEHRIFIVFCFV